LFLKFYGNRNNADEIINQLPVKLKEKINDKASLFKKFVCKFGKSFAGYKRRESRKYAF